MDIIINRLFHAASQHSFFLASELITGSRKDTPDGSELIHHLANLSQQQEWESALELLLEINRHAPEVDMCYWEIARCLGCLGKHDQAHQWLSKGQIEFPGRWEFNLHRAMLYAHQNMWEEALGEWIEVNMVAPQLECAYRGIAEAYRKLGQSDNCEKWLKEGLSRFPAEAELYAALATYYYRRTRKESPQSEIERMISLFTQALELGHQDILTKVHLYQVLLYADPKRAREFRERSTGSLKDGEEYNNIWELIHKNDLPENTIRTNLRSELDKIRSYLFFSAPLQIAAVANSCDFHLRRNWTNQIRLEDSEIDWIRSITLDENETNSCYMENINVSYLRRNFTQDFCDPELVEKILSGVSDVSKKLAMRHVFSYQMVADGFAQAVSPFSGKIIKSHDSFYVHPCCYYRFDDEEPFYLITDSILFEYYHSKLGIYFPRRHLLILGSEDVFLYRELIDLEGFIINFQSQMIANASRVIKYLKSEERKIVAPFTAHQFAHHIWNELPFVENLIRAGIAENIDKYLTEARPMGKLGNIFPEIADRSFECDGGSDLFYLALNNNYFVIKPGAVAIQNSLTERLQHFIANNIRQEFIETCNRWREQYFPLIWIGVRVRTRTCIDQKDGLIRLIKQLTDRFPRLGVVIDGFSFPCEPLLWGFESVNDVIAEEKDLFDSIRDKLSCPENVISAIGLHLYESLFLANFVDGYICHHGTSQHKFWLAEMDIGIVHANAEILKLAEQEPFYVVSNVRSGMAKPCYIPSSWVETVDGSAQFAFYDARGGFYLDNYRCNWERIGNLMIEKLEYKLNGN